MFLWIERDKYFSSLLYSICEGLNSFFCSETQKEILSDDMSKKMSTKIWIPKLSYGLMVNGIDLKFTFFFVLGAQRSLI